MGVEEKGVISKGAGRCSALSFATWVQKEPQSGILMLHFLITFATPKSEKIMINPLLCQQD